ncbi:hypothetical protein BpHYR1_019576, partial [Brachionus plicatilis]
MPPNRESTPLMGLYLNILYESIKIQSSALACKPPHPGLYAPASSSPLLFIHPGLGPAMWA